jgi:hypothetical protein
VDKDFREFRIDASVVLSRALVASSHNLVEVRKQKEISQKRQLQNPIICKNTLDENIELGSKSI